MPDMTAAIIRSRNVLVLDMATIRFRWGPEKATCAAVTSRGEVLAVVETARDDAGNLDVPGTAYRAFDEALGSGSVLRVLDDGSAVPVRHEIALYNPFTGEVAIGAVPATITFADGRPVELDPAGVTAVALPAGAEAYLELSGGRTLLPRQLSLAGLTRVQEAHAA